VLLKVKHDNTPLHCTPLHHLKPLDWQSKQHYKAQQQQPAAAFQQR
jgi:hypothetical protein